MSKIPISPEIIGPGIEEEYADAMERIIFLLNAFKDYPAANDTAHGRVGYQLPVSPARFIGTFHKRTPSALDVNDG